MELLLVLFKYLTASLTPWQFLAVLAVVAGVSFLAVRWALKRKKALMSLIKPEDENLKQINEKLALILTQEEFDAALDKIALIIKHEIGSTTENVKALRHQFVEISTLRQEIVDKEFEDLKAQQAIILSTVQTHYNEQHRLANQVDNLDEFVKAAVPEFRAYHRDLVSDMRSLGRDIALIERSVQMSIAPSAVKLR